MVITYTDKLQKALRFQEKVIDTTKAHTDLLKTAMDDNTKVFFKFWGVEYRVQTKKGNILLNSL